MRWRSSRARARLLLLLMVLLPVVRAAVQADQPPLDADIPLVFLRTLSAEAWRVLDRDYRDGLADELLRRDLLASGDPSALPARAVLLLVDRLALLGVAARGRFE